MATFDSKGNCECLAGETLRILFSVRRRDGSFADLTGLKFIYRIYRPGAVDSFAVVVTGVGTEVEFIVPGTVTYELGNKTEREFEIAQLANQGRITWMTPTFKSRLGGPFVKGDAPVGSVSLVANEVTQQIIVSTLGAPGSTVAATMDLTVDEYNQKQAEMTLSLLPMVLTVPESWPYDPPGTVITIPKGFI